MFLHGTYNVTCVYMSYRMDPKASLGATWMSICGLAIATRAVCSAETELRPGVVGASPGFQSGTVGKTVGGPLAVHGKPKTHEIWNHPPV